MDMRRIGQGWLLAAALFCLAGTVPAATTHTVNVGGDPSAPNYFANLAALDTYLLGYPPLPPGFSAGDELLIILHNGDNSIQYAFPPSLHASIRVRPAGGNRQTITHAAGAHMNYLFFSQHIFNPGIALENVRIAGNTGLSEGVAGVAASPYPANRGGLEISNSIFENNISDSISGYIGTLVASGNLDATITDSVFSNNSGVNVISVGNEAGETTNINLVISQNAASHTIWDGGASGGGIAILMDVNGTANLNADIAAGKKLEIRDDIIGIDSDLAANGSGSVTFNKTGGGVLKLGAGGIGLTPGAVPDVDPPIHNLRMNIGEGAMQFGENSRWLGGSISVGGGGVFKPGITPGNLVQQHMAGDTSFSAASSYFFLDNFQSSPGARLEIGGISLMPDIGPNSTVRGDSAIAEVFYPLIQFGTVPPSASNIAPSMTISNNLMEATLEFYEINDLSNPEPDPEKIDGVRLHITKVNNLSTLTGVGSYADVYRLIPTLSEAERDFLDHIYAVGGAYGEALGFLQTLGGAAINYSMLAMRHNLNQARRKIQRRNVDYQKEELAEKLAISSDQSYGSLIPSREGKGEETVYHGIWAYIDQSWMDQDDYGNLAGYRYNPYGIGIGYERHHDEWIFGGLLRYDDGTIKLKSQGGTRTDVQNLLFSAYASWASQGWYLNGSLEGGIGWNDSVSLFNLAGTPVVGRSGDYGTSVLGASLESGYMMDGYLWGNNLRMTPYGGLGYSRYDREGFRETGAGNLNRIFADGKTDIWEWSLGLRLAMPFEFGNFTLIPSFDAAWIHRMDDPRDNGNDVSLATAPGSAWRTDLFEGRNAAALSGGLSANFKSGLVLGAEFDLEMRKKAMGSRLGLNISRNF